MNRKKNQVHLMDRSEIKTILLQLTTLQSDQIPKSQSHQVHSKENHTTTTETKMTLLGWTSVPPAIEEAISGDAEEEEEGVMEVEVEAEEGSIALEVMTETLEAAIGEDTTRTTETILVEEEATTKEVNSVVEITINSSLSHNNTSLHLPLKKQTQLTLLMRELPLRN